MKEWGSYAIRTRETFARMNERRWNEGKPPIDGVTQMKLMLMSGFAHDVLDYCSKDAMNYLKKSFKVGRSASG